MPRFTIATLLRTALIIVFPIASALTGTQSARADAGAEFTVAAVSANVEEARARVYAVTREDMDYMGVSRIEFYSVEDARSKLDVIRGLIAKLEPTREVSLMYWCNTREGLPADGINNCAKYLLKKHCYKRYSAFAKSLVTTLDPEDSNYNQLSKDTLTIANAPELWLGQDYTEVSITDDFYSVDVMVSLMISRDLKRVAVTYYDFGA